MKNVADMIKQAVLSWPGVTLQPHRFGGTEFCVSKREFGHLHGDYQADVPFSVRLRDELVASGKAAPHHLYPNSGWVTYYIRGVEEVPLLIELLRLNYDRLAKRRLRVDVENVAA